MGIGMGMQATAIRRCRCIMEMRSITKCGMTFPEVTEVSLSKVVTMTTPPPIFTPCRKLHGDKKTQVEEQLRQWERDRVIERCESSWAPPIHTVKKSDGRGEYAVIFAVSIQSHSSIDIRCQRCLHSMND